MTVPSRAQGTQQPRRSPATIFLSFYFPLTVIGLVIAGVAFANGTVAAGVWALCLLCIALVGLLTNLRVSNGALIMRRRLTIAWRRLPISGISYARVDNPWADWGAPGGLSGVTLVLKTGEQVPVLESGTFSLEHAERWLDYMNQLLEEVQLRQS